MLNYWLMVFQILAAASLIQAVCREGVYEQGVSSAEQKNITDKHNSLRLLLAQGKVPNQPKAINMKRLQYDARLAQEAQNIANTCVFEHVSVQDPRWGWVGQNLLTSWSSGYSAGADWNGAIQGWFDENKFYHYPDNPNSQTGHYTQVAWANTEYVGCGYTFFPTNDGPYRYQKLYVCNYGPGGNIIGQAPYKTGTSGCENLC